MRHYTNLNYKKKKQWVDSFKNHSSKKEPALPNSFRWTFKNTKKYPKITQKKLREQFFMLINAKQRSFGFFRAENPSGKKNYCIVYLSEETYQRTRVRLLHEVLTTLSVSFLYCYHAAKASSFVQTDKQSHCNCHNKLTKLKCSLPIAQSEQQKQQKRKRHRKSLL